MWDFAETLNAIVPFFSDFNISWCPATGKDRIFVLKKTGNMHEFNF